MKEIKLTQGKFAIVDDAHYNWLNQWKWYARKSENTFYATREDRGVNIHMHRLILGLSDKSIYCDHIDGNGLNNKSENLRPVTKQQNSMNSVVVRKNNTGFVGVSMSKTKRKFRAHITIDNKFCHLGYYSKIEDALAAREDAVKIHFGEFARDPNVIQ